MHSHSSADLKRKARLLLGAGCSPGEQDLLEQGLLLAFTAQSAPGSLSPELSRFRAEQIAHNLKLLDALEELLSRFDADGINVLVMKGAVLALQYYGNISWRAFQDIDLLITAEDLPAVSSSLSTLGFLPQRKLQGLARYLESASQHAEQFVHPGRKIAVDVHWRIGQSQFDFPELLPGYWQRSRRIQLGKLEVETLSSIDTLIALLIAAGKDCWQPKRVLLDILLCLEELQNSCAAQIPKQEPNLQEPNLHSEIERFRRLSSLPTLEIPLAYLAKRFPDEVPIDKYFLQGNTSRFSLGTRLDEKQTFLCHLEQKTSLLRKARYCLARLCIPHLADWDTRLPDFLVPLVKPFKTVYRALRH